MKERSKHLLLSPYHLEIYIKLLEKGGIVVITSAQRLYWEVMPMKRRFYILSFVAILSLSLLLAGFSPRKAQAFCEKYPFLCGGWTQDHVLLVPPIEMYEPFFELFDQRDRPALYKYREAVKLAGHSCGATSSAWEITKKALELLYPGETPVRGDIMVYAPGAEDEWNIGVIGEVITYITGAAPHTGFSGAEFGNGAGPFPGDPVFVRRNKMVYAEEPLGTWPPNGMMWRFERIDTGAQACIRFNYVGPTGIQPPAGPDWVALGAKVASGMASPEEVEQYTTWWNDRVEYVFDNADSLVVVMDCPVVPE
jgi:hypothetical protein